MASEVTAKGRKREPSPEAGWCCSICHEVLHNYVTPFETNSIRKLPVICWLSGCIGATECFLPNRVYVCTLYQTLGVITLHLVGLSTDKLLYCIVRMQNRLTPISFTPTPIFSTQYYTIYTIKRTRCISPKSGICM